MKEYSDIIIRLSKILKSSPHMGNSSSSKTQQSASANYSTVEGESTKNFQLKKSFESSKILCAPYHSCKCEINRILTYLLIVSSMLRIILNCCRHALCLNQLMHWLKNISSTKDKFTCPYLPKCS